ncbi:MFS general substrate transporter [Guyanagaster necrorhizus]|uniref:MFS general substrate transporter n=1 Tax=Guyanagaster necrorhizus TaxID=856835 RepID=A0A9P7VJC1_9AGAR|nr:MFS general substrate transporter [Guyanagaster necrorhizus MCA 3950]KAG7441608.1 MFS general substrate transporter [Guyanagaster necrorhizus MCA 3950]
MPTPNPTSIPGHFSLPRIRTLLVSLLVALGAGTNYVYSAYAPQMGHRLNLSHTQLNLIALGGNVGVYSTGPVWGKIVDARGPRILMVASFALLLLGYSGIRLVYDVGLKYGQSTISTFTFCLLTLFGCMTGAGGNSALTGGINSTAKSFPERLRASTTGIVLSGFGLSAFLFSSIAHFAFPGDTSSFLLVLSLGTALPEVVGYFFIRPIPLPASEQRHVPEGSAEAISYHENSSQTRLLGSEDTQLIFDQASPTTHAVDYSPGETSALELSPPRSISPPQINTSRHRSQSNGRSLSLAGRILLHEKSPNIYGWKLWCTFEFWLIFSILLLLSGTGIMYINNVGSMSQALFAHNNPTYDENGAVPWQAAQVSAISIMNCLGRIIIGLLSDFAKHHYETPRCYSLMLVSLLVLISQILASQIDDVRFLWQASSLLGLAYGSIFGTYPTLCIELFGMPHFSENWGYISLAPMVGGNVFSLAFGKNLDAHGPKDAKLGEVMVMSGERQCLEGKACYVDTLYLTIAGCFLAFLLSVYACWRDRQKHTYHSLDLDDEDEED